MRIFDIKLSVTTDYLIKTDSKQYILVDTGYEYDWELFRNRLKTCSIDLMNISYVILTHHHDDHCGFLHLLLKENPRITVVMSEQCSELITVGRNDFTHGGGYINRRIKFLLKFKLLYVSILLKKHIKSSTNLTFKPYPYRNHDILIYEDTRLKDIGIDIEGSLIFTPGHTVDSISLLLDNGQCLVGDAAAHMLTFAGTKNCVIFINDLEQYYRSWELIIDKGAQEILPAHGNRFSISLLKQNIRKYKKLS